MASMPHGRLGPPLWSFAADAHDCIMVRVRLDRPHTSSWRDAAPVGGLPLRSLWLIPPGAPCRGPQTEPDGGKKPEKKRLTEKAPYKFADQVQISPTRLKRLSQSWLSRSRPNDRCAILPFDLPPPQRPHSRAPLAVWMRDVLGASDHLEGFGQSARIERRIVTGVGTGGRRAQACVHDHLR